MSDLGSILAGGGSLLGAGSSIASGLSGKQAQKRNTKALEELIGQTTSDATGIMRQTSPLRSITAANLIDVLSGGRTSNLQVFAPEREAIESQFGRARGNLIAGGQPGGQLNRSMADLNIARAQSVSGLEADVRRRAFEDALRIGYGAAPAAVFPAFQGSQGALLGLASQGANQQAGAGAGLGSIAGLGALMALKQGRGGGSSVGGSSGGSYG